MSTPQTLQSRIINLKVDGSQNSYLLYKFLLTKIPINRPLILLCIGTDRCTGDSLGPLIGTSLTYKHLNHIEIFGTLDEPVHAKNLSNTIESIKNTYVNPFIIAIDASLGSLEKVNTIDVGVGSLKPGAALNKDLEPVGDLFIKGYVNVGGFLELNVLQTTRLSTVMKQANLISQSIHYLDLYLQKHL